MKILFEFDSVEVTVGTVAASESGEGFPKISKEFQFSHYTVLKIVFKCETFRTTAMMPSCGCPTKFTPTTENAFTT